MTSLGCVIEKHDFSYHCYADGGSANPSLHCNFTIRLGASAIIRQFANWLPVPARIKFKALIFAYKTTIGSAPLYLNSLLQTYVPSRSLHSASEQHSAIPAQNNLHGLLHLLFPPGGMTCPTQSEQLNP